MIIIYKLKVQWVLVEIKPFKLGVSFWDVNPAFTTWKPFNELYKLDNGGETSSNYMWAVNLFENNDEEINPQYTLSDALKLENLLTWFPDFDETTPWYIVAREEWDDNCMTFNQRMLKNQQKQIKEYQAFIDKTPLTLDEPDPVGKMRVIPGSIKQLAALSKTISGLFKELKELEELFQLEKTEAQVKGGRAETASEKGLI